MYNFLSRWNIPFSVSDTYAVIVDSNQWQSWWKGLESVEVLEQTKDGTGSIYMCTWRRNVGYRLRTRIVVSKHIPNDCIKFDSAGDLVGSGSFVFSGNEQGTLIDIRWDVTPTKHWMKIAKPLLKSLFISNHNKLMRQGEAGLIAYLRSKQI